MPCVNILPHKTIYAGDEVYKHQNRYDDAILKLNQTDEVEVNEGIFAPNQKVLCSIRRLVELRLLKKVGAGTGNEKVFC